MISEEQLIEWERLANEATRGPRYFCENTSLCQFLGTDNARFYCAASEAVPALITEVRELRKALILESSNLTDALCQTAKHKEVATQLEKEVEWLADNAKDCPGISGASTFCWRHCPMWIGPRNRSGHCEKVDMREAARRATEDK